VQILTTIQDQVVLVLIYQYLVVLRDMQVEAVAVLPDLIGILMGDHMKEEQQLMEEVLVLTQMELHQHILVQMELRTLVAAVVEEDVIIQQHLFLVYLMVMVSNLVATVVLV
jgi:hypothetical protein